MSYTGFNSPIPFDPRDLIKRDIKFKDRKVDYLQVKDRQQWKNAQHPDWAVRVTLLSHDIDKEVAVCLAEVVVPIVDETTGFINEYVISSDIGSETGNDFRDYFEKAATKARGRALAGAGFDTADAIDFEIEDSYREQGRYPGVNAGVERKGLDTSDVKPSSHDSGGVPPQKKIVNFNLKAGRKEKCTYSSDRA